MKYISRAISAILLLCMLSSGMLLEKKLNDFRLEKKHKTELSIGLRSGRQVDFEKLKELNEDAKAWIYLPGSEIDYPVVQGEDNDYYLHRDLDGKYLYEGTLFIEAQNEDPFHDFNTVIYGHHMFSGSMFCGLDKYRDRDYFNEHGIIQITTEEGEYDLHVIAYCNEPSESDLYTTLFSNRQCDVYADDEYTDMPSEGAFTPEKFTALIREKAEILSSEPFDENDTFVTLSTCAYNYDDARTQVIGVLRPPAIEMKTTETISDNPLRNIWLLAQIAVGALMITIAGAPLIKKVHGRTRKTEKKGA